MFLGDLSILGTVISVGRIKAVDLICLEVKRLLLCVQLDLLVNFNRVGVVLTHSLHLRKWLYLVVRILVD